MIGRLFEDAAGAAGRAAVSVAVCLAAALAPPGAASAQAFPGPFQLPSDGVSDVGGSRVFIQSPAGMEWLFERRPAGRKGDAREHRRRPRPAQRRPSQTGETPKAETSKPETQKSEESQPARQEAEQAEPDYRPKADRQRPAASKADASQSEQAKPASPAPVAPLPVAPAPAAAQAAGSPPAIPAAESQPARQPEKERPVADQERRVPGQVLVLIRSSQAAGVEAELGRAYGLDLLSSDRIPLLDARMHIYRVRNNGVVEHTVAEMLTDPRVMAAQPNFLYRHQRGLDGGAEQGSERYAYEKLQLPSAHERAKGRGVLVAVIDSAIDASHPDLAGAIADSYDAAGGGKDVERDVHGAAVAGVIAGRGATPGAAPEARLLAVRAFASRQAGRDAEAETRALIRGVQWAVDHGANVLNLSFTGPEDSALQAILAVARIRKVVLVAAAGDGGPGAPPVYPAAYPEVIAVSASDSRDRLYENASRGRYVDVTAPGVHIFAPLSGGGRDFFTGTSFAAAEVSGVAALLLERRNGIDPLAVQEALTRSSDSLGPEAGEEATGAGRVNALGALQALEDH